MTDNKIHETIYLTLEEGTRYGTRRADGTFPVVEFRVSQMRKSKPTGLSGAVVVKLNISIDPSIFDAVVPVVNLDLGAGDVILPTIEVQPQGETVDGS